MMVCRAHRWPITAAMPTRVRRRRRRGRRGRGRRRVVAIMVSNSRPGLRAEAPLGPARHILWRGMVPGPTSSIEARAIG